jgi:hypothetical protein
MSQRWRLLAWAAALALGLRALHGLGGGPLGVPLTSMDGLSAWVDQTPPEVMALALVRLAALACGWYLAVCTLVLALTRPLGRPRLAAAVTRLSPAVVCRIVSGSGSVGLALGTLLGGLSSTALATTTFRAAQAAAAAADPAPDRTPPTATATMTRLPTVPPDIAAGNQQPVTTITTHHPAPSPPPAATMTRLPAPAPTPDRPTSNDPRGTTTHAPAISPPPAATMARAPAVAAPTPAPPVAPIAPPDEPGATGSPAWIVEPGDSFWSIAVEVSGSSTPGAGGPSDRQVVGYWRRLIEANRSRLLDPANPDLLVPGQELIVPRPTR